MEDEARIERLPLTHPLPEEIQKMKKDDTVCQFCGVSYFIHREVKLLEEKVKSIQKELDLYKSYKEKVEKLESEIVLKEKGEESLKNEIKERDSRLQQIMLEISEKDEMKKQAERQIEILKEQLSHENNKTAQLSKVKLIFQQKLPKLNSDIQKQKSSVQNVHAFLVQMDLEIKKTIERIMTTLQLLQQAREKESLQLKQQVKDLETAKNSLNIQLTESSEKARNAEQYLMNMHKLEEELKNQRLKEQNNLKKLADMESAYDSAKEKEQLSFTEGAQFKQLLQSKSHELEELQVQHKKQEQILQDLIQKLRSEIKEKGVELEKNLKEMHEMKKKINQRQRQEDEMKEKAKASVDEVEELKNALRKVTEDCAALKSEREMMIHSHQTRIEQLKESFKMKLAEADAWPVKMDEIIQKEKSRHEEAMAELERKLKASFEVELEIVKQRCEEAAKREKHSLSLQESKMKADLQSLASKHKEEISRLQKKLEEGDQSSASVEKSLKEEVENLKAIIADLENRLGQMHSSQEDATRNLKAELKEAEEDLVVAKKENETLKGMVEEGKEEVAVLQETVRRECEERFELTESLGQVKEQLMKLQKENSILSKAQPPLSSRSKSLSDDGSFSRPPYMSSSPQPSPPGSRHGGSGSITMQSLSGSDVSEHSSSYPSRPGQSSSKTPASVSPAQSLSPKENCGSLPEFTVQGPSGKKGRGGGNLKGSRRKIIPSVGKR